MSNDNLFVKNKIYWLKGLIITGNQQVDPGKEFIGATNGQQFVLVVDTFSKWVEVIDSHNDSNHRMDCERIKKKLFNTFSQPDLLIYGNGRHLTSTIF